MPGPLYIRQNPWPNLFQIWRAFLKARIGSFTKIERTFTHITWLNRKFQKPNRLQAEFLKPDGLKGKYCQAQARPEPETQARKI